MKSMIFFIIVLCAKVNPATFAELPTSDETTAVTANIIDLAETTSVVDMSSISPEMESSTKVEDASLKSIKPERPARIFGFLRDFLFQARDGLMDPSEVKTERHLDEQTERAIQRIEDGLIEATTILVKQMENSAFSTLAPSIPEVEKGLGDDLPKERMQESPVENLDLPCSSVHTNLETCVQQCFTKNTCTDIQKYARSCPTASQLCNPFSPWTMVDDCKNNADCKKPLLCCHNGCVNKCTEGV